MNDEEKINVEKLRSEIWPQQKEFLEKISIGKLYPLFLTSKTPSFVIKNTGKPGREALPVEAREGKL